MYVHDLDPIAWQIGSFTIHWYGLSYVAGILIAWRLLSRRCRANWVLLDHKQLDDLIFYATLGILLGGRLGSVFFYHWDTVVQSPLTVFSIHKGGMSFHGGLIGVILASWLFARKHGLAFLQISDFIAPVVPVGLFLGRIANFINGELWGAPSRVPWAVIFPKAGNFPRHPSQLYEAMLEGVVLFLILWCYTRKPRPLGVATGLFLALYGCFRCAIEFVRQPDRHIGYVAFDWLTMGHVLSVPMILVGSWLFLRNIRRHAAVS